MESQGKGPVNFEQEFMNKYSLCQKKNSKSGGRYSAIDESHKAFKMSWGLHMLSIGNVLDKLEDPSEYDEGRESQDPTDLANINIEEGSLWLNEYLGILCKAEIVNRGIKMINISECYPLGCCIWKCNSLDRLLAKDPVEILFPDINLNNKKENIGHIRDRNTILIDEYPLLTFVRYTKDKACKAQVAKDEVRMENLKTGQKEIPGDIYIAKKDHSVVFELHNYLYDEFLAMELD